MDYIKCSKCNSISYYDPYFKKYVCQECGHMEKDNRIRTGIVMEKRVTDQRIYFIIQDCTTYKRNQYRLDIYDTDVPINMYETVVLYDVIEYKTENVKITYINSKYNLLLDEIMRR